MKAEGIRIPVSWGHQPDAVPCDERDRAAKQFYLSRYNAGYLGGVDHDGDDLSAVLDVPGCEVDDRGNLVAWTRLPDGREVKAAVGEVSAAVRDWTDGTGKTWPDAIIHVALTPLPVVANQPGFVALSTLDPAPPSGRTFYLSLAHLLSTEESMAEETKVPGEGEGAETKNEHFQECLKILESMGLKLPPDTTPENLYERVCVAGHAMGHAEPDGDEGGDEPAETYSGEDEEGAQPTEEPRPVMMSLSTARTPAERKLISIEQDRRKKSHAARIDKLVKRGLPVARANALRKESGGYELSLTAEGEPVEQGLDRTLSLLEEVLPKRKFTEAYLSTHGTQEPRPDADREDSPEEIRARAAAVSVSRRQ